MPATPMTDQVVREVQQAYETELVQMLITNNDASVARAVVRLAVVLGAVAMSEFLERERTAFKPLPGPDAGLVALADAVREVFPNRPRIW